MVRLYPVVPAHITTIPPVLHTKVETGKVVSPGCSNTISTFTPFPVMSQIALPNFLASANQSLNSGLLTVGNCPQQLKSFRLITPLAPSLVTNSRLSSSDITAIAFAPAVLIN